MLSYSAWFGSSCKFAVLGFVVAGNWQCLDLLLLGTDSAWFYFSSGRIMLVIVLVR